MFSAFLCLFWHKRHEQVTDPHDCSFCSPLCSLLATYQVCFTDRWKLSIQQRSSTSTSILILKMWLRVLLANQLNPPPLFICLNQASGVVRLCFWVAFSFLSPSIWIQSEKLSFRVVFQSVACCLQSQDLLPHPLQMMTWPHTDFYISFLFWGFACKCLSLSQCILSKKIRSTNIH